MVLQESSVVSAEPFYLFLLKLIKNYVYRFSHGKNVFCKLTKTAGFHCSYRHGGFHYVSNKFCKSPHQNDVYKHAFDTSLTRHTDI
jgi:hypothetical protein